MAEPVWIERSAVLAIHDEQIAEHGGSAGVRDLSLLDSALARPRNRLVYTSAEVPELAALYALGIVLNHPFLDGNKRTGLVVAETFIEVNGYQLLTADAQTVEMILGAAAGEVPEPSLIDWVRAHALRISPSEGREPPRSSPLRKPKSPSRKRRR